MRFHFSNWNQGGKLIFIASCLAFLSFFFKWVELFFVSQNGFAQGTVMMFVLFLYPLWKVLKEEPLNKTAGYICAILGVVGGVFYISSKSTLLGNAASTGPYVFIIACLLLAFGVRKYNNN